MSETGATMRKVPDLIHEYARAFYEWHLRAGRYRIFSHRQKFDAMTDDQVGAEMDRLKIEIIERYADAADVISPELRAAIGRAANAAEAGRAVVYEERGGRVHWACDAAEHWAEIQASGITDADLALLRAASEP